MRSWKMKLFATFITACLSLVFFSSPVFAATVHTSTRTSAGQAKPLASGGGCTWNYNNTLEACISLNGVYLNGDAYVANACFSSLEIDVYSFAKGAFATYSRGTSCSGHYNDGAGTWAAGNTYYTCAYAWIGSTEYSACSPYQYT
jgi:hypothetical protein